MEGGNYGKTAKSLCEAFKYKSDMIIGISVNLLPETLRSINSTASVQLSGNSVKPQNDAHKHSIGAGKPSGNFLIGFFEMFKVIKDDAIIRSDKY